VTNEATSTKTLFVTTAMLASLLSVTGMERTRYTQSNAAPSSLFSITAIEKTKYTESNTKLTSFAAPSLGTYWQWTTGTRLLWGDNTPIRID
jgi:hypothetical protein